MLVCENICFKPWYIFSMFQKLRDQRTNLAASRVNHVFFPNRCIIRDYLQAGRTKSSDVSIVSINQKMLDRTRLKNHMILPQTRESVVKRKERLASYNRRLFSSQSCRAFIPSISTTPDHPRVHSAMHLRTHNQSPYQSSSFKIAIVKIQAFTQPIKKCHDRSQSPLLVIRSKSRCSQDESRSACNFPIRVNFLKKGSSVDRSIIKNILASKINTNACPLAQSYVDAPQNNQIANIMQTQIPKGIRDVVGVEEMLRMSHIMTGVQFKTVSLHERVKQALLQHKRTSSMPLPIQQDDLLTLKSIKRW